MVGARVSVSKFLSDLNVCFLRIFSLYLTHPLLSNTAGCVIDYTSSVQQLVQQ